MAPKIEHREVASVTTAIDRLRKDRYGINVCWFCIRGKIENNKCLYKDENSPTCPNNKPTPVTGKLDIDDYRVE